MSVSNAIGSAIYTKLSNSAGVTSLLSGTTAIYRQQAPDAEAMPYVVFGLMGGGPLNITPSDLRDELVYVRGYAATPLAAGSIDAAISAVMHQGTLAISGYSVLWVVRETDREAVETLANNQKAYVQGGYYRISLDA